MEFRLEHSRDSPSLSVDITLRFASDKDEVAFRSNLSDLNEIRRAIAEAQERILNPSLLGLGSIWIASSPLRERQTPGSSVSWPLYL
jgi:transketolase